jgi:hypothetical protein
LGEHFKLPSSRNTNPPLFSEQLPSSLVKIWSLEFLSNIKILPWIFGSMSEFSTVAWRLCQSVKLFFESRDVFWQDALGLGPLSLTHVAGLQEM